MALIINKQELLRCAPIKNMETEKKVAHGMSYGLSEAGYDIRIKQQVRFIPGKLFKAEGRDGQVYAVRSSPTISINNPLENEYGAIAFNNFTIASAMEEFEMPADMIGRVHDKSSWARQGLSVFNTVIEPGWKGFLTLELVFHGDEEITIEAGSPIAQVIFEHTVHAAPYTGKYQNQADRPVSALHEKPYQPDHYQRGFTPK